MLDGIIDPDPELPSNRQETFRRLLNGRCRGINTPCGAFPRGALFVGYASGCTKLYATLAIEKVPGHLRAHGIETSAVVVQTDRGSDFDGTTRHPCHGGFQWVVVEHYGARLRRIHHPNQNADVETMCKIIEREFFGVESFSDRADFFAKAATHQPYFNEARPTPLELLRKACPESPPEVLLPPAGP